MAANWHSMRVASRVQEGLNMRHLTLESPAPFPFGYGQYVQVAPEGDSVKPGYFAIASPPERDRTVEFLVKEGDGAAGALYAAEPGDAFRLSDPMGPGFPREHLLGKNVILIGVGSGIAPLRSVIGSILAARTDYGERVMLLYGARTPFHIPFRDEIATWRARIEVYKAMSQPGDADWSGYVGYVQHILEGLELPRKDTIACVCGMPAMVDAVKKTLAGLGIPEDDVYLNF
jgi:NAD(P)H-flavin reductase